MSKIRGVFPLFLATAFGIFNGIVVFGPEFKKQGRAKLEQEQEQIEAVHAPGPTAVEILEEAGAEAEANAGGATERLDTPEHPRWFIVRFWEQVKSDEKRLPIQL
ncbi:MAG: hypothetical protein FRX48_01749 [Lasallia pustulata]|uniref:Uncharacterized protein n=1 Tax=Lasallia pustulata TaxID=136370 RepID=A0A5M8Q1E1_9LECA|nr:MAG: hypothetical protein FRX48_01749 [Lasallia pustulata]